MDGSAEALSLGEAGNRFLASLLAEEREQSQPEIVRFVRWFGSGRLLSALSGAEVANYAERLSLSDPDYVRKLDITRAFLLYAKKVRWTKANLATHLKAKKTRGGALPISRQSSTEPVLLTQEGYVKLEAELAALRKQRPQVIEEMRRAAADKDFRENVPLQAAREERGHLEGRIIELEETLKSAVVVGGKEKTEVRVGLGDTVILCDLGSGEEVRYTLVNPREVDPARGKISIVSPIGQALLGRSRGDIIEVAAPAGRLRYQIKQVE